jgi:hypothetical protein
VGDANAGGAAVERTGRAREEGTDGAVDLGQAVKRNVPGRGRRVGRVGEVAGRAHSQLVISYLYPMVQSILKKRIEITYVSSSWGGVCCPIRPMVVKISHEINIYLHLSCPVCPVADMTSAGSASEVLYLPPQAAAFSLRGLLLAQL